MPTVALAGVSTGATAFAPVVTVARASAIRASRGCSFAITVSRTVFIASETGGPNRMPRRPGLMRRRCSLAAARKSRVVALSGTCWGGSAATVTGWPSATIWNCGRLDAAVISASFTCP